MAYPTLEELLQAYKTQNPGPGATLESGTEGLTQGAQLASTIATKQALQEFRRASLAQRIKEATGKQEVAEKGVDIKQQKADQPPMDFSVAPGITAPEGKVAVIDRTTGKVQYQDLPGAKSGKDVTSGIADARIKMSLSQQLLSDPNYRKNQDIIDKGLRISNLSSAKDVINNPAQLHILSDLIVGQAEGGKASLAGVSKLSNETAQQFAARVMEKVTNEPESADTKAFIKQIKSISDQDMKSAYTSIKSLSKAKAAGLARIYPDRVSAINEVANNFADDYIKGLNDNKVPSFLANQTEEEKTPLGTKAPPVTGGGNTPSTDANDFLKKHGLIK